MLRKITNCVLYVLFFLAIILTCLFQNQYSQVLFGETETIFEQDLENSKTLFLDGLIPDFTFKINQIQFLFFILLLIFIQFKNFFLVQNFNIPPPNSIS
jgi:hypothetical protein